MMRRVLMLVFVVLFSVAPVWADAGGDLYKKAVGASHDLGRSMPEAQRKALDQALASLAPDASVEAQIVANKEALDLLAVASRASTADFNPERKGTIERPVELVAPLRDLCALATLRAAWRASKDAAGASADLETVLGVGRHLMADPMALFKVVGTQVLARAVPVMKANPALPGLRDWLRAYRLPAPRVFIDDEKRLFVEAVTAASTDPSVSALREQLVKHATVVADGYFDVLARSIDGDMSAAARAETARLSEWLQGKYGTNKVDELVVKLKERKDVSADDKAQAIDTALLLLAAPDLSRPVNAYKQVLADLRGLGAP